VQHVIGAGERRVPALVFEEIRAEEFDGSRGLRTRPRADLGTEALGLRRVPDRRPDVVATLEQPADDPARQVSRAAGDDDGALLVRHLLHLTH
jgi:hypothetical protein